MEMTRIVLFGLICSSLALLLADEPTRPLTRKLGTIDVGLVEATLLAAGTGRDGIDRNAVRAYFPALDL